MPKPKEDRVFLEHMLHYIEVAERQLHAKNRGETEELAVQKCIENIGEAANNISGALKQTHADVPWRDVIDTRNIVIHGYFGVSMERLWDIVEDDLPPLKQQIQTILEKL